MHPHHPLSVVTGGQLAVDQQFEIGRNGTVLYVGNPAQTIMGIGGQPNGDSSSSVGRVRHAVYMHQSDAKINGGTRLRDAERTQVPRRTPLGS